MGIKFLAGMLAALLVFEAFASGFPKTADLQQSAMEADNSSKVLVIYVTMEGCPYCAKLEAELLTAAYNKGELDIAHFVELEWAERQITDFDGSTVSTASFMEQYGVVVTPTILFLGSSGEELSARLVGYQSEDFYWRYLLEGIEQAGLWDVN
jgi:thioredoxin-related protein